MKEKILYAKNKLLYYNATSQKAQVFL